MFAPPMPRRHLPCSMNSEVAALHASAYPPGMAEMAEGASHPSSLRDRYLAFIARHEMAWELAFGALAVAYVVIAFAADGASPSTKPTWANIELTITVVFILEFASRILASYDRRA